MKQIILLVFVIFSLKSTAQHPVELGGEYQRAFGQGFNNARAAVRGEYFSSKSGFSAGITYALASKKSYSVSRGFGLFTGYRYYFSNSTTGSSPFIGARIYFLLKILRARQL